MAIFRDSNGITHNIKDIQHVFDKVGNDWERLGYAIRRGDTYADHVTEEMKDNILQKRIVAANEIRNGIVDSFTIWQRINEELTGQCVALLP